MNPTQTANIYGIGSLILVFTYLVYSIIGRLNSIARNLATMNKSKSKFWKAIRKKFYIAAMLEMRTYIRRYCELIKDVNGYTVQAIVVYELDLEVYKHTFIESGFDKLYVEIVTKLEEITKFVYQWRAVEEHLTTTEIVQLYLNETKP